MAVHNTSIGNVELNGLAAKFIAETNAFLDRFLAHPEVGWPLKCDAATHSGVPLEIVTAGTGTPLVSNPATPFGLAAVPELIARLKRLHQPLRTAGNGATAWSLVGPDGEPSVYVILMLVPKHPSIPAAAAFRKSRGPHRIHTHAARVVGK